MTSPTEFLNLDDVLDLCRKLFGDPLPISDIGLLGSAVARPQTIIGEKDAYPSIEEKAAMLLYLIVKNHAFVDGNKRIAAAVANANAAGRHRVATTAVAH